MEFDVTLLESLEERSSALVLRLDLTLSLIDLPEINRLGLSGKYFLEILSDILTTFDGLFLLFLLFLLLFLPLLDFLGLVISDLLDHRLFVDHLHLLHVVFELLLLRFFLTHLLLRLGVVVVVAKDVLKLFEAVLVHV